MKKVIIDCDPGLDDLIALVSAPLLLDIVGITVVAGNQLVSKCTQNALDICSSFGIPVPVYKGAERPLLREQVIADKIHGENGIGDISLERSRRSHQPQPVQQYIRQQADLYGGDLEIVALGPLTNIALTILEYPDIVTKIREITVMGGAHQCGNVTPSAEFNIYADAESAKIVFGAGIPIAMVGLDATMSSGLPAEAIDKLFAHAHSYHNQILKTAFRKISAAGALFNLKEAYIHDLIAVLAAADDSFVDYRHLRVDIETKGKVTYGKTVVDFENTSHRDANVFFGKSYDKDKLDIFLEKLIAHYETI